MSKLMDQQRQHFETSIQSLKKELQESTLEVKNLKAICLENHQKLQALEEKV